MRPSTAILLLLGALLVPSANAGISLHLESRNHFFPYAYARYHHLPWIYQPHFYPVFQAPSQVPVPYLAYPRFSGHTAYPSIFSPTESMNQLSAYSAQATPLEASRINNGLSYLIQNLSQQIANRTGEALTLLPGQITVDQFQVYQGERAILISGAVSEKGRTYFFQMNLNLDDDQLPGVFLSPAPRFAVPQASATQEPKTLGDQPWYPPSQSKPQPK
ncbi:MAG: hypothetical protein H7333_02180 [Bdellovibrionales bacterium]|nr:hypothetical protein [Oligoflexia bacterium]